MSTALTTTHPNRLTPWLQLPGETTKEYLMFWIWRACGGALDRKLARRFGWTERANMLDALTKLVEIKPGEELLEAATTRAKIVMVEIFKLHKAVLENSECVLDPAEVMKGVEWMTTAAEAYTLRRKQSLDWSRLSPEEREIMLKAKEIQDRLLHEIPD